MAKLYFNNTEIKKLYFNGVEVKKGYFNNELIFNPETIVESYWEYKASSDTEWIRENMPASSLEVRIPFIQTIYPSTLYDININTESSE